MSKKRLKDGPLAELAGTMIRKPGRSRLLAASKREAFRLPGPASAHGIVQTGLQRPGAAPPRALSGRLIAIFPTSPGPCQCGLSFLLPASSRVFAA